MNYHGFRYYCKWEFDFGSEYELEFSIDIKALDIADSSNLNPGNILYFRSNENTTGAYDRSTPKLAYTYSSFSDEDRIAAGEIDTTNRTTRLFEVIKTKPRVKIYYYNRNFNS